ncbi:MAG: mandelate racemase/muconate lactonizing enzyme family protein [Lautropia sp.]
MGAVTITEVITHPLRAVLPQPQRTAQATYAAIEIVVVELRASDGSVGWGECLARRGCRAYAAFIDEVLAPILVGADPDQRRRLWAALRAPLTGRTGGMLIEAIAGIDIALWDLTGQRTGLSVARLLGGVGRPRVAAYASSINWLDDETVQAEVAAARAAGFRQIKVKLGAPVAAAIARARLVRELAGDGTVLGVDANWAYDVDDALAVGRALADLGYDFFEEPIRPEDRDGYRRLARALPIRLAAGESDYTAGDALVSLADRSVGMIQPDVARAGGITETWRIAELAAAHRVRYAPHVGWSGALCAAASLQLAAAAEAFWSFECMVCQNPLRQALTTEPVGDARLLADGMVPVPDGPGLGVTIDRHALASLRV